MVSEGSMGKTAIRISKTNNRFPQQNNNSATFFCRYCRIISFTERVINISIKMTFFFFLFCELGDGSWLGNIRAARGTFSFFFESLTAVCKMKWTFSSQADRLWLIV